MGEVNAQNAVAVHRDQRNPDQNKKNFVEKSRFARGHD
jgi:hypothetical protein